MSDVSQGPDWWLASDGKWYPPQSAPAPPPPPQSPSAAVATAVPAAPAKKKGRKGIGCLTTLVIFVLIVVIITVATSGGSSSNVTPSVRNVAALDGNTIRIFIAWTNKGKAAGSASCVINTTVNNQFGDLVNIRVNSTNTNGNVKPGQTQILYQDIGVDNGDAQYVTPGDVKITNC
jgi:hypothetical protein